MATVHLNNFPGDARMPLSGMSLLKPKEKGKDCPWAALLTKAQKRWEEARLSKIAQTCPKGIYTPAVNWVPVVSSASAFSVSKFALVNISTKFCALA